MFGVVLTRAAAGVITAQPSIIPEADVETTPPPQSEGEPELVLQSELLAWTRTGH